MIQPGGETHIGKLFFNPQVSGSTRDHLRRQISSRSSKRLRCLHKHCLQLGNKFKENGSEVFAKNREDKKLGKNQGIRVARRPGRAGDHSIENIYQGFPWRGISLFLPSSQSRRESLIFFGIDMWVYPPYQFKTRDGLNWLLGLLPVKNIPNLTVFC